MGALMTAAADLVPTPTGELEHLAQRIREANDDLLIGLRTTVEKAVKIGALLREAKAKTATAGGSTGYRRTRTSSRGQPPFTWSWLRRAESSRSKRIRISNLGVAGAITELRRNRRHAEEMARRQRRRDTFVQRLTFRHLVPSHSRTGAAPANHDRGQGWSRSSDWPGVDLEQANGGTGVHAACSGSARWSA